VTHRWLSIAALSCAVAACESPPPPHEVVTAFLEAHNRFDHAAATALVAPEIRLMDAHAETVLDRDGLRQRLQWDSVLSVQWRAAAPRVRGDTVILDGFRETSAWHQLLGLGFVERADVMVLVTDGMIREIRLGAPPGTSPDEVPPALDDFLAWVQHEYPERLQRVRPEGRFAANERNAAEWLSLIRAWKGDLKQ
jgi:hypothetical protein